MLQSLSDFFLIISKDGEKITNKDISSFYTFIVKKMPQIEQQYPSLTSFSLNITSNDSSIKVDLNKLKSDKDSKKIFTQFQKQMINLFNELIDFCYNTGIIKLNNKYENLIKKKINDKIKKSKNNNDINKEYRNFVIFLIINGDINFDIYPHQYVNFFNTEKKLKNLYNIEKFMKFVKTVISIYKENKKNEKKISGKVNIKNEKKVKGTENKIFPKKIVTNIKDDKKNKVDNLTENNKKKINCIPINKNMLKPEKNVLILENSNKYKIKSNSGGVISSDIRDDESEDEDEINDTIKCETPKNCSINIDMDKKENMRKYSLDKNFKPNIYNNRLTVSTNIKNIKINKSEFFEEFPLKKFHISSQREKKEDKNKKINNYESNGNKYNVIKQTKVDKNNNQFEEIYINKDDEIQQHLVIYKEEPKQIKNNENDEDDIKCIIF